MNARTALRTINQEKKIKANKAELKHIGLGVIFFFIALILFGCSAKEQVVYKQNIKEIYIPVKCEIKAPVKPTSTNDVIKDNINIITYTMELEQALKACIREE